MGVGMNGAIEGGAVVSAYIRLSAVGAYITRAILRRYEVAMGTDGLRCAGLLQEIVKNGKV